ncbi:uncharacterized protein LOC142977351 [Anticarsia gemmatalis]|uniref:uncharacterized protein LOC142977351 n=1 Tax=Anticarsia gemmatalis TaxID=129554 RepID=UPI003F76171D
MRDDIITELSSNLVEENKDCELPPMELYLKETVLNTISNLSCGEKVWAKCYRSQCQVEHDILATIKDVECEYYDVIHINDYEYYLRNPVHIRNNGVYELVRSDHVMINCSGVENGIRQNKSFYSTGFRKYIKRRTAPEGREETLNVVILMIDSVSRNDFMISLPKSYDYLTKFLNGTILKGYNIVGDGSAGSLFPIFTGHSEEELSPYLTKNSTLRHVDVLPFIFYQLKRDGYRTAYMEDMPWLGNFEYKFNGFRHRPADHYLRHFYVMDAWEKPITERLCAGDTFLYQVMLNKTNQFLHFGNKIFCFTLISELTSNAVNFLSIADGALVTFLQTLVKEGHFRKTLLLVMGDHGSKFNEVKDTLHGRLEERLPFMCVILPEDLKRRQPDVEAVLRANADTRTTPYDVHATILDAVDLPQYMNRHKVAGAKIPRGMSLFKPIPRNRTCWEAGVEPHWCPCYSWVNVPSDDALYPRVAETLVRRKDRKSP